MIDILDGRHLSIKEICKQQDSAQADVSDLVRPILENVRLRGDAAVLDYTEQFDGVRPDSLRVTQSEIDAACDSVGSAFIEVLRRAANNIRTFHQQQMRTGFEIADADGIIMGQKFAPLARVGVYVPGGTAPYPSTVLMDVIPAKIAGVDQIIMVTPPGKDGAVNEGILAAASVAGVTEIYKMGGAQAIAALAYGTETIPRVDKIVGPGNIFVATAKKLVYGIVDIDMIAGPSDILVVADDSANPAFVAADMLGQAEHDKLATAVLVTTSEALAKRVQRELECQLEKLPRREIAEASITSNGRIILAHDIAHAIELANAIAPEHLELCVDAPEMLLPAIRNAGSIFLGHYTPEALGDYYAGPNHTLPTMGTARFYSPLSVDDFVKKSSYLCYTKTALAKAGSDVITFARREQLDAHANSVAVRVAPDELLQ